MADGPEDPRVRTPPASPEVRSAPRGPVTILGRGRVGGSLAAAFTAAGQPVDLRSSRDAASFADGFKPGELVVLAVPDDAIAATAERVAESVGLGGWAAVGDGPGSGTVGGRIPTLATTPAASRLPAVVHLSGASGIAPVQALADASFAVGVAHPYYPFPEQQSPSVFRGITFGLGATTAELGDRLDALVRAIGAVPRQVDPDGWVAYHASGVLASNYLVVLAAQAAALLEQAGFDRDGARDALIPLMRGTLDNLAEQGVDNALSGPLRRSDVGTVDRHLAWLDDAAPDVAATYRALAGPGIDLALGTGLSVEQAERLRRAVE